MIAFIDASPTPYHAVQNVAAQLREDGFSELDERQAWTLAPGDRRYVIRDAGTIVAFVVGARSPADAGFRVIGAHTDSPNLRLKPNAPTVKKGYLQLGVETYGGVLLSTWLDRDLSLAGRVSYAQDGEVKSQLVDLRRPNRPRRQRGHPSQPQGQHRRPRAQQAAPHGPDDRSRGARPSTSTRSSARSWRSAKTTSSVTTSASTTCRRAPSVGSTTSSSFVPGSTTSPAATPRSKRSAVCPIPSRARV